MFSTRMTRIIRIYTDGLKEICGNSKNLCHLRAEKTEDFNAYER